MNILEAPGIHYMATRFGWPALRRAAFDAKYKSGRWSNYNDGQLRDVVSHFLIGHDLLILGCGAASVVDGLDAKTIVGVDLSSEAISLAGVRASPSRSFVQADMMSFIPQSGYRVILFSESIYYIPTDELIKRLRELSVHLDDKGVFIASFCSPRRHQDAIRVVRQNFILITHEAFEGSSREFIVFKPVEPMNQPPRLL
jgi:trans-aconitate methyltransferase